MNQLFIDTVRKTGGNNAKRLLVIAGYSTDIKKTCDREYKLPKDTIPGKLFISVHYYTPYQFCGLTEDADWGKMMTTWGTADDVKQLNQLFDMMKGFCTRNDIPAFIGEFGVASKKKNPPRAFAGCPRWPTPRCRSRMVPVLWDTGADVSRNKPYAASARAAPDVAEPGAGPAARASASVSTGTSTSTALAAQSTAPAIPGREAVGRPKMKAVKPAALSVSRMARWGLPRAATASSTRPRPRSVPNPLFADHAVLQQGTKVPVWGTADPGEAVTVEIAGQSVSTTAGADGKWLVRLAPLKVGGPFTLTISGKNQIVLTDILVGEVWVAGGQSNMERQLGLRVGQQPIADWENEVAAANYPQIRHFGVAQEKSLTPLATVKGQWTVCTPETVKDFTAVGYFFGRDLQLARHVPDRPDSQLVGRHAGGGLDQRGGAALVAGLRRHVRTRSRC